MKEVDDQLRHRISLQVYNQVKEKKLCLLIIFGKTKSDV
jgi:hypothetical protein